MIDVIGDRHLANLDMLVDMSLAALPLRAPEPRLIGGNRNLGTQLDHPVVAFDDLNLCTGSIEVMAPSEIRWKHDLTPPTDADERPFPLQELRPKQCDEK
jgi:hypothetical protein